MHLYTAVGGVACFTFAQKRQAGTGIWCCGRVVAGDCAFGGCVLFLSLASMDTSACAASLSSATARPAYPASLACLYTTCGCRTLCRALSSCRVWLFTFGCHTCLLVCRCGWAVGVSCISRLPPNAACQTPAAASATRVLTLMPARAIHSGRCSLFRWLPYGALPTYCPSVRSSRIKDCLRSVVLVDADILLERSAAVFCRRLYATPGFAATCLTGSGTVPLCAPWPLHLPSLPPSLPFWWLGV